MFRVRPGDRMRPTLPVAFALPRLAGLLLVLALALTALLPTPRPAFAQQEPEFGDIPFAYGQWNLGRRLDQSQLRYCIDHRDPDWQVADDIAKAIAGALLLEPVPYEVKSDIVVEDITRVYALLLEDCDIHMGFKLIPDGYPDWLTISRGYYDAQYVFVTADPNLRSLADLPTSRPVGATIGTTAHIQMVAYVAAQPANKRWQIFPYGANELALDAVLKGEVGAALVWAPSLWGKQQSDPAYAKLRIIDSKPLQPTRLSVGAVMLSDQTFLRTAVDQAIAALTADGTLQSILNKYKFPATAKP
jgi:polar amino acid transport system substrate-binding protein